MHSAGGFIGSQAVKGLSVKDQQEGGHSDGRGVSKLVFLAGALFTEGVEFPEDQPFVEYKGDRMYPKDSLSFLFNDFSPSVASAALEHFSHQPTLGWEDERVSYCGWRDLPSVYLCCENDHLLPSGVQLHFAAMAGSLVESCQAGHMVMLSQVDTVVDVIRRAVGEEMQGKD